MQPSPEKWGSISFKCLIRMHIKVRYDQSCVPCLYCQYINSNFTILMCVGISQFHMVLYDSFFKIYSKWIEVSSRRSYLPFTLNSESRRRNPFPAALPSLSPRQETSRSPEARQWDVCGYANPVFWTISAGSTTLCKEGAFGFVFVSITYIRPDLKDKIGLIRSPILRPTHIYKLERPHSESYRKEPVMLKWYLKHAELVK